MGQLQSAYDEYARLYERTHDPQILACMGYCMSLRKNYNEAIGLYLAPSVKDTGRIEC